MAGKKKYALSTKDCCYCYISKDLKKQIEKIQKELQRQENTIYGRKAKKVTFSYASKEFAKLGKRYKRWFI